MKAATDSSGNRVVRKIRIRAILFLLLALLAGGGAVMLVKNYMDQMSRARSAPVAVIKVVVAAVDVAVGTPLAQQHLAVASWPVKYRPAGSFGRVEDVVGKTLRQSVVKGEPILGGRLADEAAGRGLTAILGRGMRAMAVKVDQVVGVAGFVQPGDFVDVITTMTPDEETKKDRKEKPARISKIILQNVRVLAVGQHMATQGTKPVRVRVVTLEVNPTQTEKLALATRYGSVQLTMRSRIDQENVPTEGITPVALLTPDEGAVEKKEEKEDEKASRTTKQWLAMYRRRMARKAAAAKAQAKPEPKAPVVEVLRGDKIEERKLRPTADSK